MLPNPVSKKLLDEIRTGQNVLNLQKDLLSEGFKHKKVAIKIAVD